LTDWVLGFWGLDRLPGTLLHTLDSLVTKVILLVCFCLGAGTKRTGISLRGKARSSKKEERKKATAEEPFVILFHARPASRPVHCTKPATKKCPAVLPQEDGLFFYPPPQRNCHPIEARTSKVQLSKASLGESSRPGRQASMNCHASWEVGSQL
jgi:hypothetical protein